MGCTVSVEIVTLQHHLFVALLGSSEHPDNVILDVILGIVIGGSLLHGNGTQFKQRR
jgi:hypothetical protein